MAMKAKTGDDDLLQIYAESLKLMKIREKFGLNANPWTKLTFRDISGSLQRGYSSQSLVAEVWYGRQPQPWI